MMEGAMGSMMGGMMGLGWVAALLVLILLIAGIVLLVRMLARRDDAQPRTAGMTVAMIVLAVLAVSGAVALVGAGAMALMHTSMMGCC